MRLRPGAVLLIAVSAGLLAVAGWVRACLPGRPAACFPAPESRLLDLNQATARELETLPGIGKIIARRVVALRQRAGKFTRPEDLLAVKGIGPKKMARILPHCTVRQNPGAGGSGDEISNQEVCDEALYP